MKYAKMMIDFVILAAFCWTVIVFAIGVAQ